MSAAILYKLEFVKNVYSNQTLNMWLAIDMSQGVTGSR